MSLLAFALALAALIICVRLFGPPSIPAWSTAETLIETIAIGLLFGAAAMFGAWFGLIHRLRRSSELQRQKETTHQT